MKPFDKPLSAALELHYVSLLSSKEDTKVKEAKEILINRNMRLVAHVAKKYQSTEEEMEDLLTIGCIGLMKAIDTFDASKGRLATYAGRCIENELLMYFRNKKKTSREVSLYEPLGQDKEGNDICFLDVVEAEGEDVLERLTLEEDVERLYRCMDAVLLPREKQIILLRYGLCGENPMTQTQVGEIFDISRSYVSRIEKKALQKLKNCFENM